MIVEAWGGPHDGKLREVYDQAGVIQFIGMADRNAVRLDEAAEPAMEVEYLVVELPILLQYTGRDSHGRVGRLRRIVVDPPVW